MKIIPVSWFRPPASRYRRCISLLLVVVAVASGLALSGAVKAKTAKKKPVPKPPAPKVVGAAGPIALAQRELDQNHLQAAVDYSTAASAKAPILDDYAQFIREQAEYRLQNYAEVGKAATRVVDQLPLSPFVGPAAALAVRADLESNSPKQALELVRKYYKRIPQPQGQVLLARCYDATGEGVQAAKNYQRVYYDYPVAKEATDAANALVDLQKRLGTTYPPITPADMLGRAKRLIAAKNPQAARIELTAAIPELTGPERDLARVRLGEVDFLIGNIKVASDYLNALHVDEDEADAERISYLIRCARNLDKRADVKVLLDHLEQQHPNSPWRLDALIYVADQARVDNDPGTYLPLYRACAVNFEQDPRSAWCHWRVAYQSYRTDANDAYDLLRKYIEDYPASNDANNALYFLGRSEERKNQLSVARACYEQVISRFPNTYFALVARQRLKDASIHAVVPDPAMLEFLHSIEWPEREEFPSFTPGPTARQRIGRAQLLQLTGLDDLAEGELKFGARNDGEQENLYAYELARSAAHRGAPEQALHYIKAYAPNYLFMPFDQAPAAFWQLAFPMPYRAAIEHYSRSQSLDPFLVAALIRQESEFNAHIISHANAYGLMQVLPSTGRELARHFGIRRLKATQLLDSDRNLQLGTLYFHNLLNSYGGQTELTLASYNAGIGRANLWRNWGPFREPAEFIETVPFHETRGYVQVVLRNADVYQKLYAGTVPDVPAYRPKPPPRKKTVPRRTPHKRTVTRTSS